MSFGKECSLLPLGLSPELCISESLDSQFHTSPGTRPHRVKRRGERDLVLKTGCVCVGGGCASVPPVLCFLSWIYWWSGVFSVVICSRCHLRSSWPSLERPCFSRKCLISLLDGLGSPLIPMKLQGFLGLSPHFLSHCPFNFGN